MRVRIYRNLNRKGVVFSVMSMKTKHVIARVKQIYLKDCFMRVSQAGRARVLKQKRKNVHAFIEGTWLKAKPRSKYLALFYRHLIRYNPYELGSFYYMTSFGQYKGTKKPIKQAHYVFVENGEVRALV